MNKAVKSPAYIFDIDKLTERMNKLNSIISNSNIELCYAIKANPFLIKYLEKHVGSFEVCSPGEYDIYMKNNIDPKKIVLSGVYKDFEDIERIVKNNKDKTIYTIESREHLNILNKLAKENKLKLPVIIRLTSGNQFGIDQKALEEIIKDRNNYDLRFQGIQYYSGTQKKKTEIIYNELIKLKYLIEELEEKYNFNTNVLEYGPGLAVSYFSGENIESDLTYFQELVDIIKELDFKSIVNLELGRYIAYCSGEYITKVVDLKTNNGINYAIINGGINHLNYYGQTLAMKIPYFEHIRTNKLDNEQYYTICGSLCTVSDVIVRNLKLNNLSINDILIFKNVGAYSITEGIYLFLSRDLPRVYIVKDNEINLVRDFFKTSELNTI